MSSISCDACCVINLFATGELSRILAALGLKFHLPSACANEALCLHQRDDKGTKISIPIDLSPFIQAGLITPTDICAGPETVAYVGLAASLDDGEAMALAIAQCRGWTLASDDRKACRIAKEKNVPTMGTPELMRLFETNAKPLPEGLAHCLKNIEQLANFKPKANHPLGAWWWAASK